MSDAKRFILDYRNDCDDCDYFDNQCHSCVTCDGSGSQLHTQQIIQKTVRVSSSEYMMNKATVVSSNNRYNIIETRTGKGKASSWFADASKDFLYD